MENTLKYYFPCVLEAKRVSLKLTSKSHKLSVPREVPFVGASQETGVPFVFGFILEKNAFWKGNNRIRRGHKKFIVTLLLFIFIFFAHHVCKTAQARFPYSLCPT